MASSKSHRHGSPIVLCSNCSQTFLLSAVLDFPSATLTRDNVAAIVAEADGELNRFNKEIKRVRDVLNELRHQRDTVLRKRNHYRYIISGVRRLPTETWIEIFSLACYVPDHSNNQNPVTRIAGVCKQWREILLALPALWASFAVVLKEGHLTTETFGKLHISRSKPLPLQIRLVLPSSEDCCETCLRRSQDQERHAVEHHQLLPKLCMLDVFDWLMESSDRWSRLRFSSDDTHIMPWLDFLRDKVAIKKQKMFGNLESLVLGSQKDFDHDGEEFDLGMFAQASSLKHLSLFRCNSTTQLPPIWKLCCWFW
ncbi:hypothetical protein C8J56DRAFT_1056766 [Mycena floridula]|nr:hypothetical protein C8J56DRAFT_1056766 [Mycena floridula]